MSRRTLGIDGHRLAGTRTGVGRYVAELLREWSNADIPFAEVRVYVLPGTPAAGLPFTVRALSEPAGRTVSFHWTLGRAAAHEVDLLFCPSYAAPLAYRGRFVVTVHDALTAVMSPEAGLRQRLRHEAIAHSARRAHHVITVSETSKRDIERLYGVARSRITAIPNGCAPEFFEHPTPTAVDGVRRRYELDGVPFCLFAGKFARRRELPTLVRAFAAARKRLGSNHALVLVGENALGEPVAEAAATAGIADAVRLPGHVPDPDLCVLYSEAEVFVYPSWYEGFGLPVLEAMAAGTPVLTVRNSSLAEIAGEAAWLVTEPSRAALEHGLVSLLSDEALRRRYIALGLAQARRYSWQRTAESTMAVLAAAAV